ncbi:MAG: hypothetical protein Q9227_006516 [Pyrenula ochraceoflavens]
MPDNFGEPLPHNTLHARSASIQRRLSLSHSSHSRTSIELEAGGGQSHELQDLGSQKNFRTAQDPNDPEGSPKDRSEEVYQPRRSSDLSILEDDPLLNPNSSSTPHMKRTTRSAKSRSANPPELSLSGEEAFKVNGHADGDMNAQFEMRRKHPTVDSPTPASQTAMLMGRESFSLDDEIPQTPKTPAQVNTSFSDLPREDKRNFLLLVLLYFLQGIPMGLASGSVPFLLKKYLSYSQIGVFSLASYPYSLKLLWSPIVDAVWSRRFGRRKSWITPIQTISGFSLIYLGGKIDKMMEDAGADNGSGVWGFTGWWFLLVFLCATQDIAVDGWAISLISIQNISYASTAQTVGLTAGSFLSHTVFLAFQAPDFANRWFRTEDQDYGVVTLGGYMTFWGWFYLAVTLGLVFLKKEQKDQVRESIKDVYVSMWQVLRLRNILTIIIIHLIAKIGFVTNDAVTNLKLLDKGFGEANLALVILIDFPFEISLGYYAGKWSTEYTPLRVWCWAFVARLAAALFAQATVMIYPEATDGPPTWFLLIVIVEHVYSTFMNTVMFVAISAFHAKIADPTIGGTYMTLLAT